MYINQPIIVRTEKRIVCWQKIYFYLFLGGQRGNGEATFPLQKLVLVQVSGTRFCPDLNPSVTSSNEQFYYAVECF